jgi:AraC-like DNA-binding protein
MDPRGFSRYLTWSDGDEKWQLVCVDAGHADVSPGAPYPPEAGIHPLAHRTVATGRTVAEYQLVYITRGQGELRISGRIEPYAVGEGSVILVLPGVSHAYRPNPATGWTERWVGFKGPWADALQKEGILSAERPVYSPGLDSELLELFEELFSITEDQKPFYQARSASLVMRLLAEILARSRNSEQDDDSDRLVSRAKFCMAEHIYGTLSIDSLDDVLGGGHARLNEVFKNYTGMTPYQYFIQLKIHRAKELLGLGRYSVKEIAFTLGFSDPYYFSRLFKKKTGIAPSEWR